MMKQKIQSSAPRPHIVVVWAAALSLGACEPLPPRVPDTALLAPDAGQARPDAAVKIASAKSTPGGLRRRTVYVPAYSHLPTSSSIDGKSMLSILLSVRNIDSTDTVVLTDVDYYDTFGHRVRRYLDAPRELRPLETAEFTVSVKDDKGGSGANFLVYWEGPPKAHDLLTESVMIGYMRGGYVGFTSRGIELEARPDPKILQSKSRKSR